MTTMSIQEGPYESIMLKLMYITNKPAIAKIAADAGVDRIFIDMEVLGKAERQKVAAQLAEFYRHMDRFY